jgi:hypothetical protein
VPPGAIHLVELSKLMGLGKLSPSRILATKSKIALGSNIKSFEIKRENRLRHRILKDGDP